MRTLIRHGMLLILSAFAIAAHAQVTFDEPIPDLPNLYTTKIVQLPLLFSNDGIRLFDKPSIFLGRAAGHAAREGIYRINLLDSNGRTIDAFDYGDPKLSRIERNTQSPVEFNSFSDSRFDGTPLARVSMNERKGCESYCLSIGNCSAYNFTLGFTFDNTCELMSTALSLVYAPGFASGYKTQPQRHSSKLVENAFHFMNLPFSPELRIVEISEYSKDKQSNGGQFNTLLTVDVKGLLTDFCKRSKEDLQCGKGRVYIQAYDIPLLQP